MPMEAKNIEVSSKNDRKDNERVEIQAEGANDSTIGNEIDINSDMDNQGEIFSEGKLQQEIEKQAQQILDQQMKMKGTGGMSAAAAALNNAEMGITTKSQTDEEKKVLSISSD